MLRIKLGLLLIFSFLTLFFYKISANGSGLCDGGAIEARQLMIAPKLNSSTKVEPITFSPTIAKPLLSAAFLYVFTRFKYFHIVFSVKQNRDCFCFIF